ncbi:PEX5-related protein isoform 1 [Cricetulus griseus]|uniref:PEX5-related protein isoform 1 n=1 Tax=Cricetulus griseus TaxID=10029 RepID=A0A061IGS1_CRIGR|nr:PEX5-related protein isoform 1 [Cricetulus griseus]
MYQGHMQRLHPHAQFYASPAANFLNRKNGQASSGNEATGADAKNSGMSDSEMDGRTHIPSLLNALLSRNRVMQMNYLKSKEQGYGKLSSDEDLEIIVDQKQFLGLKSLKSGEEILVDSSQTIPQNTMGKTLGKGSRAADKAVAMVMKEIPREESAEEKPLLTVTSQLVSEQQESRPLLSPSIDDFLCETKSEAIAKPVTSNTAVLTTGLDLLDLSEPVSQTQTKAKKSEPSSKSSSLKKKVDGSDLISTDAEQRAQALRGPETSSLDLVDIQTQLEKWDDVKFHGDRTSKGHLMAERKSCSSRTGSKELLWSSEHRSQPELSTGKSALNSESASELELVAPAQARLTKEHRWGSALLSRNHSLEEEFERAKAAVECVFRER